MARVNPVSRRVENLLTYLPDLRSNDRKLLLAYWRKEGLELTPEQEAKFMLVTAAESITRARRALRHQYPGNVKAEAERYQQFKVFRNEYGEEVVVI